MITVKDIFTSCEFGLDKIVVTYDFYDTSEKLTDYTIDLYRSEVGMDNTFYLEASNIPYGCYEDFNVDLFDENKKYFYKIQCANNLTGEKSMSDTTAAFTVKPADGWGHAIADIENVYLHNVIRNEKVFLLKKIRSGTVCQCWDDIRMTADTRCPICYGTGYVNGYFYPMDIEVNYANTEQFSQAFSQEDMQGEVRSSKQFWTSNFPIIAAEDVIVDSDNFRWRVISVMPTKKDKFILRQIVNIEKIPKTDMVYKIPVGGDTNEWKLHYTR